MRQVLQVCLLLLLLIISVDGFYIPGTATDYQDGDYVQMDANVLTSINTHLPYEYYSLPYPRPAGYPKSVMKEESENLGEILMGDRIRKSPYKEVQVGVPFNCKPAGDAVRMDSEKRKQFEERIKDDYVVHLILDHLPVSVQNLETNSFSIGFPIGAKEGGQYVLYNHLSFLVKYHPTTTMVGAESKEVKRIVAFQVKPHSYDHKISADGKIESCTEQFDPSSGPAVSTNAEWVAFTYSVTWEQSADNWATRWDPYLNVSDSEIHWFSIVNSLMIVLFLTGMVAVIMMRTLRKDITRYNSLEDNEELQEETGWKLVHTDVFRPPSNCSLLATYTGTGVQLIGMSITVLIFASLGFLSPANRGALFTALLLCFVFLGIYGGYTAARLMKMWSKPSWRTTLMTATVVPGEIFLLFFLINLFVWSQKSSAAVPIGTIIALVALWFCISAPLVFLGSILGYKKAAVELPVRTNQIPRHTPEQPWYMQAPFTVMMGGILPFGAVFIELFFILTSIWLNRYYYVFGFLFIVFIILVITCAEITIVMIYFQLCSEDYHWWWRSYLTSGSSGLYLFLYSIFYFFTSSFKMKKFVSVLLFFGYMGIISYIFFVMTGTMGFLACFVFVRKIYSSIKVD
jgi:transmembrane 9 superfamily protein 2/4